jgi:hypothetical protein
MKDNEIAGVTRLVTPRAAELLKECRRLLREGIGPILRDFTDRLDDTLFDLANEAASMSHHQRCFAAMRELRLKRPLLERALHARLDLELDIALGGQRPGEAVGGMQGVELRLVEHEAVDEDLAIARLVGCLERKAGQELFALDRRVGHLLSDPDLDRHRNPFGAAALGEAVRAMAGCLELDVDLKLTLCKLYERTAAATTVALYAGLNEHLRQQGVLRDLRPGEARKTFAPRRMNATVESQGEDVFQTLQRLLRAGRDRVAALTGSARPNAGAATSSGTPSLAGERLAVTGTASGTAAFITQLTALQKQADVDGQVNTIRRMREQGLGAGLGEGDDLTLDIVALLFDYILRDPSIADAFKAQIGRLQIPYLKVGLLDRELFSRKSHPARRLLDAMAEAAAECPPASPTHDTLHATLAGIVTRIVEEFDRDLALFEQILAGFEAFRAGERAARERRISDSTASLRARERIVLAKLEVDAAVKSLLGTDEGRDFVNRFVLDYWRERLIVTHVEQGAESEAWHDQLALVEELLWSVRPKTTAEDRKALSTRLPGLLRRLRAGMSELQMPPAVCSKFLTMLASVQVVAVKRAEESSLAERVLARRDEPSAVAPSPPRDDAEILRDAVQVLGARQVVDGSMLDIDFAALEAAASPVGGRPVPGPEACAAVNAVLALDLGDWLTVETGDDSGCEVRFTYISPATGRYLFTDRDGRKAFDLSFDELTALFDRGAARRVDGAPDPLFDRALNALMHRLAEPAVA